jgi:hypothetical protein
MQEFTDERVLGLTVAFYKELVQEAAERQRARRTADEPIGDEAKDAAAAAD